MPLKLIIAIGFCFSQSQDQRHEPEKNPVHLLRARAMNQNTLIFEAKAAKVKR